MAAPCPTMTGRSVYSASCGRGCIPVVGPAVSSGVTQVDVRICRCCHGNRFEFRRNSAIADIWGVQAIHIPCRRVLIAPGGGEPEELRLPGPDPERAIVTAEIKSSASSRALGLSFSSRRLRGRSLKRKSPLQLRSAPASWARAADSTVTTTSFY